MSQDISLQEQSIAEAASHIVEDSGDIQRYVVAPGVLEMMGPVQGKEILDLFCGAGYLSRRLAVLGAHVTAVDTSERLIGIAGEIDSREDNGIKYAVADPTDLSVVDDSSYDDIICNMGLMATRDLAGTIAELARLVKLGGRFIFSVLHPCFDMPDACWSTDENGKLLYKTVDNYYNEGWWLSDMVTTSRKIKHRTLATYVNALSARGFTVRRIMEPKPSEEVVTLKPHLAVYERVPVALIVEAIFPYI